MQDNKWKKYWLQLLVLIIIIFLTVEDVILIIQNKELKASLSALTKPPVEPLNTGERVEPFKIKLLNGDTTEINYDDPNKSCVLFILSTTCPHCENNLAAWKTIVESNHNAGSRIIGVSVQGWEKTKEYYALKNVSFNLASVTDTSFSRKYKIGGVPVTILIRPNGVVEKVWRGELTQEQTMDVIRLISSRNPIKN